MLRLDWSFVFDWTFLLTVNPFWLTKSTRLLEY